MQFWVASVFFVSFGFARFLVSRVFLGAFVGFCLPASVSLLGIANMSVGVLVGLSPKDLPI